MKEDAPIVSSIDRYERPEEVVCRAARGDYMNHSTSQDTPIEDVMDGVDVNDRAYDKAQTYKQTESIYKFYDMTTLAKMISLIEQLIDRQHWGPFEHPHLTLSVDGISRVCMAQGTRHRLFTFDVQSQRYVDFSQETEVVLPASIRGASLNREKGLTELTEEEREEARYTFAESVEHSVQSYERLLDIGMPKEDARFVLPEGTSVNMTMSGNMRMFMHVLNMRRKANAQWEIRDLMNGIFEECRDYMPITFDYFDDKAPFNLSP